MHSSHPHDALVLAREHSRRLRAEAAAERLRVVSCPRRALARSLRCAAERSVHAPLARRPAGQV